MTEKKIKVALFIDSFFPKVDGVIMVVDNYAKILQKQGYEVFVAAPGKKEVECDDNRGYTVHRCMEITKKTWSYTWPMPGYDIKFKKAILEEKPDIVHIHSPFGLGKEGVRLAKKLNIPVVATMHSQFDQDFYKATKSKKLAKMLMDRVIRLFHECDEVFTMSKNLEKLLLKYNYRGKMRMIPNATDMRYPSDPQKLVDYMNTTYHIKDDEKVFLFVGRLIEAKGVLFLVDVLNKLKQKGHKFKMFFVGGGPDEEQLREKIKQNNLQNEIILTGKIMDREILSAHYLRADLFLFPSLYDNDSLVQREAGVNKTPSVFSIGAMTAHSITDNYNGFLAEYDVDKYTNRIEEILQNEPLLKEVSETIHKEQITWEQALEKATKAYSEIIENHKKKHPKRRFIFFKVKEKK